MNKGHLMTRIASKAEYFRNVKDLDYQNKKAIERLMRKRGKKR